MIVRRAFKKPALESKSPWLPQRGASRSIRQQAGREASSFCPLFVSGPHHRSAVNADNAHAATAALFSPSNCTLAS